MRVRASTARTAYSVCSSYPYMRKIDCRPVRSYPDGTVAIASGAARYNPVFYWVVGLPTKWLAPLPALFAMRFLTALLGSFLMGLAAWAMTLWARTGWPLLAVLLTATPTATYSGSTPAPNGPEMFAGIALWSLLLGLRQVSETDRRIPALLLGALPAALVLTGVRTLGPLWLVMILSSVVPVIGVRRTVRVVRAHRGLVAGLSGLVAAATGAALWWTLSAGTNSLSGLPDKQLPDPLLNSLRLLPIWVMQSIGAFPDKLDAAPGVVYGSALFSLGGVVLLALTWSDLRSRLLLVAVAVSSLAVPLLFTLQTVSRLGSVWQGRYAWPYAGGVLVLAGVLLEASGRRLPRVALAPLLLVVLLMQLPGPLTAFPKGSGPGSTAATRPWLVGAFVFAALTLWLVAMLRGQPPGQRPWCRPGVGRLRQPVVSDQPPPRRWVDAGDPVGRLDDRSRTAP